jgi:dihydroneopterin aldolase
VLGNNPDEKNHQRKILINVAIRIPNAVYPACISDQLDQTVCYADMANFIDGVFAKKKFNLLEKASQFLYDELFIYLRRCITDVHLQQRVEIRKPSPFHDRRGDVSFVCSDW